MNENAGTTPSELSVSSLVTGIGKLVFDISGQTATISGKVEALEDLVSKGLFERLDRIIQAVEAMQTLQASAIAALEASAAREVSAVQQASATPAATAPAPVDATAAQPVPAFSADAFTAPLEAGLQKLSQLEVRMESIEKAVTESAGFIPQLADPIVRRLESIEGKADSIGTAIEGSTEKLVAKAGSGSEAVCKLLSEQDERIGTLLQAVLQIGQSSREVSGVTADLPARLESLDRFLAEAPAMMSQQMSAAAVEGISPVQAGLTELTAGVASLPASVKAVEEGISARVAELDARTASAIAGLGGTLEAQKAILDDMRITLGEAAQGQEKSLADMAGLLRTHRDAVARSKVDDLNNEAIHHFNQGRLEEAAASIRSAMELDPTRPELLANLGHIEAATGNIRDAEENFRKALVADPFLEPALSGLGLLFVKSGRPRDTLDILSRFIDDPAPSSRIALACSRALAALDRHADAVVMLQRAASADPGNPDLESELSSYKAES